MAHHGAAARPAPGDRPAGLTRRIVRRTGESASARVRRTLWLETELERERAEAARLRAELERLDESVAWGLFQGARRRLYDRVAPESRGARALQAGLRALGSLRRVGVAVPAAPVAFPDADEPLVSLVVAVAGRAEVVDRTLRAVAAHTTGAPYEVILVDDASDPATRAVVDAARHARVLRHPERLGYLETTNHGAEAARGRWIVLLNDDVEPLPGWLEALLDCAESAPRVGAVAPRYLDGEGRLLEAGAIVWSNGEAWNYGRGDVPYRARYEHRREIDYGSAAALLVRAEAWRELGGFDRRYLPMYWEDADLAFRLREAGWRVLYEPRSLVIHHEGSSSGTDEAAGMKRHQAINRPRFAARWSEQLAEQPEFDPEGARRAADRRAGPHVLVADHRVPSPDRDSGSQRMERILGALLDLGCRVSFLPLELGRTPPHTRALEDRGVEVLDGGIWPKDDLAELGPEIDLAILSRPAVAATYLPMVREHAPGARVAYDAVDLHFVREERRGELEGPAVAAAAAAVRELELAVARACDLTLCVSEAEADALSVEVPGAQTHVVSNAHDIAESPPPRAGRQGLLFVGGYEHGPNVDAARHLVRDVMPLVWETLGDDVTLTLAGAGPPEEVLELADARVRVPGWVADVGPLLDDAVALVAPLRYGAGVKGKVTQSLARGLPVVTTPVGAEGTGAVDGEHLLVARDEAGLAAATARLYRDEDLWRALSENGRELARANWSDDEMRDRLTAVLGLSPAAVARP
ncbi:MAG: hypothetical protein QOE65_298 [Solirubrobacteraceae bacterium]|nr:hypothetical protein [Solirubrobacteraceae bacterium]